MGMQVGKGVYPAGRLGHSEPVGWFGNEVEFTSFLNAGIISRFMKVRNKGLEVFLWAVS